MSATDRLWTRWPCRTSWRTAVIWTWVPAEVRSHMPGLSCPASVQAPYSGTQTGWRSVAVTLPVLAPRSPSTST